MHSITCRQVIDSPAFASGGHTWWNSSLQLGLYCGHLCFRQLEVIPAPDFMSYFFCHTLSHENTVLSIICCALSVCLLHQEWQQIAILIHNWCYITILTLPKKSFMVCINADCFLKGQHCLGVFTLQIPRYIDWIKR